jgi:hypothetical protein
VSRPYTVFEEFESVSRISGIDPNLFGTPFDASLARRNLRLIPFWEYAMNGLLWVLQVLAALLYAASGVMKIFIFDKISADVPSFGALPRGAWMGLGILELVCVLGLIVPAALHWRPALTVVAPTLLAVESLVFIWVHVKYGETGSIIMSAVLGLLMAFIAYGRMVLKPIA